MTSIDSIDSASILSTIPHDMLKVLAGVQHIMETSLAQDSKLLEIISILATQAEQIKVRDQSIMIMQSKIDSQQAIIEEIRSEQRLLTSTVAALSQCQEHAPEESVTLSPPDIRETPEPVTHSAATSEKSGTSPTILVLEQPTSKQTPKHASNALSDTTDAAACVNLGTTTTDDTWRIPECYAKTQRGTRLRRSGAFYDTPDWHAMTLASGGVPDSGAPPPALPTRSLTQEEIILALGNARAGVKRKLEARKKKDAATVPAEATASDAEDTASDAEDTASESDASHRSSSKRCREPDEQEARRSPNPMDISSIVNGVLDEGSPPLLSPSSGHCPVQDDGSNSDGHAKRRRLSTDVVEFPASPERKRPTRRSPHRESN